MANEIQLGSRYEELDGLTIGGVNFPNDFRIVNRQYLYYTPETGMEWQTSGIDLNNNTDGTLSYLIENKELGTGINQLKPYTNKYIMIGGTNYNPNLITGGSDGKGTGLSGKIKGQLTIGLPTNDYSLGGNNNYGSSMTDHLSLSHKEIRITDVKEQDNNKFYPLLPQPIFSIKV